jgi:hypothetical protein
VASPDEEMPVVVEPEASKKKRTRQEKPEEPKKPEPLKEPVRPVSVRRSVVDKLALNPKVKKIVDERAKKTVDNFKLMRDAPPSVQSGVLPDPGKDKTRVFMKRVHDDFQQVKRQRTAAESLTGPKLTGKSKLIESGKGESVQDAFEDFASSSDSRDFGYPFGTRRGKASTKPSEVGALNPTIKVGIQPQQMLGHLSQIFMNKVNDMEYESMLVNDRVFVASNAQAAIKKFQGTMLKDFLADAAKKVVSSSAPSSESRPYGIGAVGEALKLDPTSIEDLTQQEKDGAALLAEYEVGYHIDYASRKPILSFLGLLQHQAKNAVAMNGPFKPAKAKDFITGGSVNSVNLVEPPIKSGWHAEQALVMTLIEGGWTGGAVVSGTKRPCFGCWLTLSLLPQCGYPLTYDLSPGFIWDTSTTSGMAKVAKALGIEKVSVLLKMFDSAKILHGGRWIQFMTALEEQTDLTVDVTIGGKALSRKGLTQDQSSRSFRFLPKDEEQELVGAPFAPEVPRSPVYSYGTPPSSPGGQVDKDAMDIYDKGMDAFKAEKAKQEEEYDKQYKAYLEGVKEYEESQKSQNKDIED